MKRNIIILAGLLAVLSTGCGAKKSPVIETVSETVSSEAIHETEVTINNETMTEASSTAEETTTESANEKTAFDPDAVTVMTVPSFVIPDISVTKFTFDNSVFDDAPLGYTLDDVLSGNFSSAQTEAEMTAESEADKENETAAQNGGSVTITDDSGAFSYTGELKQIGDDEHGYIMIPADYVRFSDTESNSAIQYSDVTGQNVITLMKHTGIDYQSAAQNALAYMDESEDITGGTGATLKIAGYEAIQVYGIYSDGFYIVTWQIKDPANADDSYYLCLEFDKAHQDVMACSSTFRTAEDQNK